jgi:tRNA pseudouridine55 synthase
VIDGILPVDKPQGWTSHDVVARVRRVTSQRHVGHAGTLDPLATGLLLVLLGKATRLSSYLMNTDKGYCAEIVLGVATTTDDAEGEILERKRVPHLDLHEITACLARFTGEIDQIPPAYSAVRQGGVRLYKLARKGIDVVPEPRRVCVHRITLESYEPPSLRLAIRCGPGTYIRSLARDIGDVIGAGGYLHALRRISSGGFVVRQSLQPAEMTRQTIEARLEPLDRALLTWPAAVLSDLDAERVEKGQAIELGAPAPGNVRLYGPSGELVALGRGAGEEVRPFRVFGRVESGAHTR